MSNVRNYSHACAFSAAYISHGCCSKVAFILFRSSDWAAAIWRWWLFKGLSIWRNTILMTCLVKILLFILAQMSYACIKHITFCPNPFSWFAHFVQNLQQIAKSWTKSWQFATLPKCRQHILSINACRYFASKLIQMPKFRHIQMQITQLRLAQTEDLINYGCLNLGIVRYL